MSKMAKEFAEKYLKEELNSRLKYLGGQPDALCQAYQAALEAMAPKKKCYVFTVETRDAQAYLEPACIPPSDEDEWEDEDVEELDEEDIWSDVSGSIIYDRIYADSKEEAVQAFSELPASKEAGFRRSQSKDTGFEPAGSLFSCLSG